MILHECKRLGLEDIIEVFEGLKSRMSLAGDFGDTSDHYWCEVRSKELSVLLFRILTEANRSKIQRAELAEKRLIAAFENSSASAAGGPS